VHNDLWLGVAESDTVFDLEIFCQHFAPMQLNQIIELAIDDGELISDELLKHEGIFVFVDVV